MKPYFYSKILLTLIGLSISGMSKGQWYEDFENGLSAWNGTKEYFELDRSFLRSKGPEKPACIYVSRAFSPSARIQDRLYYQGVMTGDSTLCIEVGISLSFVPSSTNQLRIYLFSLDSVLSDTACAYYLQLGSKGSENYWQLYRSGRDTTYCLWQGDRLYSKQSQMTFNLRVVYRPDPTSGFSPSGIEADEPVSENAASLFRPGRLSVYHSSGDPHATCWSLDGDSLPVNVLADILPDIGTVFYIGIMARYRTPSRASQYAFDYVNAGRLPQDSSSVPVEPDLDSIGGGTSVRSRPGSGSLAINEVLFNPRSGESRFIELYNKTDTCFSLQQLAFGVPGDKTWKYSLLTADTSLQIAPFSYMAAAKDAESVSFDSRSCLENIFTARSFPSLDNKAGRIRLVWLPPKNDTLRDTVHIDEVAYSENSHHWLLPSPQGVALERLTPWRSGLDPENWMSAAETAGFATPGCENSHTRHGEEDAAAKYFRLDPPLVTPDNDGLNDFTVIRWNRGLSGCVCTIMVYDEWGRKVKTLCTQLLLGAGDGIRYDAVDGEGRILRPGLYILYIDLLRPDGNRKRLRYPLAVG